MVISFIPPAPVQQLFLFINVADGVHPWQICVRYKIVRDTLIQSLEILCTAFGLELTYL